MSRWFNQAVDWLSKQKKAGRISHWELEMSDSTRRMFGVRVSKNSPDNKLFSAKVSATYYGRDLRSAAERAVNEVETKSGKVQVSAEVKP